MLVLVLGVGLGDGTRTNGEVQDQRCILLLQSQVTLLLPRFSHPYPMLRATSYPGPSYRLLLPPYLPTYPPPMHGDHFPTPLEPSSSSSAHSYASVGIGPRRYNWPATVARDAGRRSVERARSHSSWANSVGSARLRAIVLGQSRVRPSYWPSRRARPAFRVWRRRRGRLAISTLRAARQGMAWHGRVGAD